MNIETRDEKNIWTHNLHLYWQCPWRVVIMHRTLLLDGVVINYLNIPKQTQGINTILTNDSLL